MFYRYNSEGADLIVETLPMLGNFAPGQDHLVVCIIRVRLRVLRPLVYNVNDQVILRKGRLRPLDDPNDIMKEIL